MAAQTNVGQRETVTEEAMSDEKVSPRKNDFTKVGEYELLEDFEFDFKGETIIVPKSFCYDGASIPSIGWQMIYSPFDPIVMLPSLVHDWIYSNHQVQKSDADKALKKLLQDNGVPWGKLQVIYRAVEAFGGAAWENSTDDLNYLRWLKSKLVDAGVDVAKYHFPVEVGE
jgi:hypothetical protein